MPNDEDVVDVDPLETEAEATLSQRVPSEEEKSDLAALVKMRGNQRTRFTKKAKELEEALGKSEPMESLEQHWQEFDDMYAELRDLNTKIAPLLVRCAPAKYDDSMVRVAAYDKQYAMMTARLKSTAKAVDLSQSQAYAASLAETATSQALKMRFKLPKFSGDIKKFREWWQLFKVHVHQKKMDPIEKFTWLKEALKGTP